MRIGLVSDLHAEFWSASDFVAMRTKLHDALIDAEVILLAGDIDQGGRVVETAGLLFPTVPVFIVAGNHEFYGGDYNAVRAAMVSKHNVSVLQQDSIRLPHTEPVRLIATTLWTDFNLFRDPAIAMLVAGRSLNDYRLITHDGRKLRPQDTLAWHEAERAWLIDQISQPFSGKTVVMTHHAPVSFAINEVFVNDPLSPCFASSMVQEFLDRTVDLVVWGHTHHSVRRTIGHTQFVSCQAGYLRSKRSETGDYGLVINL